VKIGNGVWNNATREQQKGDGARMMNGRLLANSEPTATLDMTNRNMEPRESEILREISTAKQK
jgi:hypothetical protein